MIFTNLRRSSKAWRIIICLRCLRRLFFSPGLSCIHGIWIVLSPLIMRSSLPCDETNAILNIRLQGPNPHSQTYKITASDPSFWPWHAVNQSILAVDRFCWGRYLALRVRSRYYLFSNRMRQYWSLHCLSSQRILLLTADSEWHRSSQCLPRQSVVANIFRARSTAWESKPDRLTRHLP